MISLGLALPHYDGLFPRAEITGADRTRQAITYAQRAEQAGFSQVWVSDHLWLDVGNHDRRSSPDCWTLLAAIAATTERVRLGSLVTAAPLRSPALLAHQVATVADIAGERLDVGLGAGWNEPEFTSNGIPFPPVAERLVAVEHSAEAVRAALGETAPPICIGGKRSGILEVAGRVADGWNLAWDPTPDQYARRWRMLATAAERAGRDAAVITRSVGLTTVIAIDEGELRRIWRRLRTWVPASHLDSISFDDWRRRGLIGTPAEVRHRLNRWAKIGVTHVVCALGMPFGLFDEEQILRAAACFLSPTRDDGPRVGPETGTCSV